MSEKDFVNKRTEDATKIFGLIERDTKSYVILFLSIVCGVFIYLYVSAKNENITLLMENFVGKKIDKRVDEQLPQEVKKQVAPIEEGWNETKDKIDTILDKAKR